MNGDLERLWSSLPEEARRSLAELGITAADYQQVSQLDFGRMMDPDFREKIYSAFKVFGFAYTALDLMGYRTGSLNETLNLQKSE